MMPTVMYPVPGGVSQSQLLKMIMATYSVIVCMAPNAVVPHSTTTRRNKQLPTTSDCQTKIATKSDHGNQLDAEQQHHGERFITIVSGLAEHQNFGQCHHKRDQTGDSRNGLGPQLPPQPEQLISAREGLFGHVRRPQATSHGRVIRRLRPPRARPLGRRRQEAGQFDCRGIGGDQVRAG
jgi:hypothetical protein